MSSATTRTTRLARYATAGAIAPVAAIGGVAQADVYSGSFTDLTLTRTSGSISIGAGLGIDISEAVGDASLIGASTTDLALGSQLSAPVFDLMAYAGVNTSGSLLVGLGVMGGSQTRFLTNLKVASAGQTFDQVATKTGSLAGGSMWSGIAHLETTGSTMVEKASGTYYTMFVSNEGDVDATYGWISFSWSFTDSDNWALSIDEWAWSDDGPLAAGATDGGTTPVPGLGGLAALALGAAGVRGRRHRVA